MELRYSRHPISWAAKLRVRLAWCGVLIFLPIISVAVLLPTTSASSSRHLSGPIKSEGGAANSRFAASPMVPVTFTETIAIFASNCTTPKTSFNLGETVCAKVVGAPVGGFFVQRRFQWANVEPLVVRQDDISLDPQTDSFTLPTTNTSVIANHTIDNRGTWRVNVMDTSDGSVRATAFFSVHNPASAAVDLEVSDVARPDSNKPAAGSDIVFLVLVKNNGPDNAASVSLANPLPANTSLVLVNQDTGPSFNCSNPSACTISSLSAGASASFSFTYQVGNVADGTDITDTATISSTTTERDNANNSSTATVTVITPTCTITPPADITQDNDFEMGHALGGAVVSYSAPSTSGSCGPVQCTPASSSFFPIGVNTVTCSDGTNEAVHFNVTVVDTEPPTITCPADITVAESSPGSGSANVTFAPTATDNSGQVTVTTDIPSGSSFPVGTTTVTATASDAASPPHTASCTFKVTVSSGNNTCSLACPSNITVTAAPGETSHLVNYPSPSISGSCGTVSYDIPSGSSFTVGTTTTVTATATGGANPASCSFTVTVNEPDTTPPTISCPANIEQPAPGAACFATVDPGTATANDDRPGVTVSATRSDGQALTAPYSVGETVIIWTATDAAGNETACEQSIKITENVPPSVTPPTPITVDVNSSCEDVEVPNFLAGLVASDNCTPSANLDVTQTPAAETLVGVGSHTITITVKDVSENSTTVTTTFNVVDNTPPTITLNGPSAVTVECHTSFNDPGATASDNCAGTFPATASGAVDVNTPGTYTITYNASDPSGNAATAVTRTVQVVDTTPPVITLNGGNMTVECHTSFTDPGATASDSCEGSVAVVVSGSVNVDVPGTYTLTYNAQDAAGNNAAAVTRTVTVVDTIAPTITLNGQTPSLWSPNHKYKTFEVSNFVTGVSDSCDSELGVSSVVIEQVTSDEAENGPGSGNTLNDIVIAADCKSVQLRAEREADGDGRVYTITFRVRDASGNVGRVTAKAVVPHNLGETPVDSGTHYTVNSSCP